MLSPQKGLGTVPGRHYRVLGSIFVQNLLKIQLAASSHSLRGPKHVPVAGPLHLLFVLCLCSCQSWRLLFLHPEFMDVPPDRPF